MPMLAVAYAASAVTMLVLDAIWLSLIVPLVYRPQLGTLLADKPNLPIAAVFYLLYVVGVVVFAVAPAVAARSFMPAIGYGALLGLIAYGTYDFTNLSTLRNWPLGLSLLDVCWGIALTAVASLVGFLVTRWLFPA